MPSTPILVTSPKDSSQRQQRLVAGGIGREALGAEQSAERIEGCGNMDVAVGVDTTGDPARSFYDGHGHPFLSKV